MGIALNAIKAISKPTGHAKAMTRISNARKGTRAAEGTSTSKGFCRMTIGAGGKNEFQGNIR